MGTKNDPGCFQRALHDEPIFTLLARDPCAAEAVRFWVTLRQALIGSGEKPLEDHNMLEDALRTASEMRVWRDEATDPATWGPNSPRWKQEQPQPSVLEADLAACRRELEAADEAMPHHIRSELLPDGEGRMAAILEKRLLTFTDDATVSLRVSDLRRIIAEETISEAQHHTVAAIKSCLPEPTEEEIIAALKAKPDTHKRVMAALTGERTDWQAAIEIANELIQWVGDRSSDRATELRALAERVRALGPAPFIAYDLADRMETKLRDVARMLRADIQGIPWPDTRKREMFEFCDRITNYATELGAGKAKAELLRNRRAAPPLGAPYTPDPRAKPSDDPYKDLADSIVGQDREIADGKINPHVQRFSSFTEGKAWACGRGISAEHVPATLDALTDRGWFLAFAYGGSGSTAVMVFRRMFKGGKVSPPTNYRVGDGGGEVVDLVEGQKP